MEPSKLRRQLKKHGIMLNEPATISDFRSIQKHLKIQLGVDIVNHYGAFNGFKEMDNRSLIRLWPMDVVEQGFNLRQKRGADWYFAIADVSIESDFLMCCLEKSSQPVFWKGNTRMESTSLNSFFEEIISGKFDV